MSKKWWVFPILFVAYLVYEKYKVAKKYKITFSNLDFGDFTINEPIINVIVNINNPTTTSVVVNNLTGNLYLDYKLIGNVDGFKPITIESGDTLVKIPVTLDLINVLQIIQLLKKGGYQLYFNGEIKIDLINIPLILDYNL